MAYSLYSAYGQAYLNTKAKPAQAGHRELVAPIWRADYNER